MKTGLVLEGGGMRGVYTSGVLDAMMDAGLRADYVIGVSAGANNGVSFVSGQRGRSIRINLNYIGDSRYLSVHNLVRERSLFGMKFLFEDIANRLDPFDYEAFLASPVEFVAGVTDVKTGRSVYFNKSYINHDSTVLRASSSIPMFSPAVRFLGGVYLDGGTTDPIPFDRAMADGCERFIAVLTRDRGYEKKPEPLRGAYRRMLASTPAMIDALDRRSEVYNDQRRRLFELEAAGTALVVAPSTPLALDRFEKDKDKLRAAYEEGVLDARRLMQGRRETLRDWGMLA